jgi:hypothetical protein
MLYLIPDTTSCTYVIYTIIEHVNKRTKFYNLNKNYVINSDLLYNAIKNYNCIVINDKVYVHKGIKHKRFTNYLMRGGYKNGH